MNLFPFECAIEMISMAKIMLTPNQIRIKMAHARESMTNAMGHTESNNGVPFVLKSISNKCKSKQQNKDGDKMANQIRKNKRHRQPKE